MSRSPCRYAYFANLLVLAGVPSMGESVHIMALLGPYGTTPGMDWALLPGRYDPGNCRVAPGGGFADRMFCVTNVLTSGVTG